MSIKLKKYISSVRNDYILLREKFSSLRMNNIIVIDLKVFVKQLGIKSYDKLRKAELIQKFEALPDVNYQVLIPWLEILRNATR